jgi:hypothetical protein
MSILQRATTRRFMRWSDLRNGIEKLSDRGDICGRGVLLDWASWAVGNRKGRSPVERYQISVSELDQVAKAQGVAFQTGDILFIRIGFING